MDAVKRNIPNALSILRIIMIIPFVMALFYGDVRGMILILGAILLSDYFDGYLARKWNATSNLGRILDPLADKICVGAVGIMLVLLRGFPLALALALIARDIIIMLAGLYLIRRDFPVPVSNNLGRVSVGVFAACLIIYLFQLEILKLPFVLLTIIMLVASIVSYGRAFLRIADSRRA